MFDDGNLLAGGVGRVCFKVVGNSGGLQHKPTPTDGLIQLLIIN
jgi:hypothetical protein